MYRSDMLASVDSIDVIQQQLFASVSQLWRQLTEHFFNDIRLGKSARCRVTASSLITVYTQCDISEQYGPLDLM